MHTYEFLLRRKVVLGGGGGGEVLDWNEAMIALLLNHPRQMSQCLIKLTDYFEDVSPHTSHSTSTNYSAAFIVYTMQLNDQ